jgi:hypothetical protein
MTKLVLTRGYFDITPPIHHQPTTLPDLVQALNMGRIERIED